MSTLKDAFKPIASKSNSSKNPKFYNEEKNRCIADMATHPNAIVRSAIASNPHTPTKVLVAILVGEQDKTVLRLAIMNDKMPRKTVAKFVADENDRRVEWFADDTELVEHFRQ